MFYAHFVLSKKGPLAKVWLAAHWERKLTKTQVFETNIEETVEDILNPKVKLALRTSGHLLLGVVRIYSRKAKYLLQDCNDALGRIKLAFRPVSIDLPVESRAATKTAITLTVMEKEMVPKEYNMTEIDFDMEFEELSDKELIARFRTNQAHEDTITLKESLVGFNKLDRTLKDDKLIDDFGDLGMGDIFSDDLRNDNEPHSPIFGRRNIFGDRVEEDGDKLVQENGFADYDEDVNHEAMPLNGQKNLATDETGVVPPLQDAENALRVIQSEGLDLGAAIVNGQLNATTENGNVIQEQDKNTEPALLNASARNSLEPRDLVIRAGNERMRAKRKRKLLVDDQKTISSEQMRAQLQDTSDIVRALDMAPSTLQLMYIKEHTSVEKMWNLPGCTGDDFEAPGFSNKLVAMFADRALVPIAEDLDDTDDFFPSSTSVATLMTMSHDFDLNEDHAIVPDLDLHADLASGHSPRRTDKNKRTRHENEDPSLLDENQDNVPQPDIEPFEQDVSGRKRIRTENAESDDESLEEDAHPEDHDRMSRRTKVVFDQFANLLNRRHTPRHSNPDGSQSVNFKELIRGHQTRKEVAQRFYSTLVLKKLQAVDVEQTEAFGEIWIKKGGRFDRFED